MHVDEELRINELHTLYYVYIPFAIKTEDEAKRKQMQDSVV